LNRVLKNNLIILINIHIFVTKYIIVNN